MKNETSALNQSLDDAECVIMLFKTKRKSSDVISEISRTKPLNSQQLLIKQPNSHVTYAYHK